MEFKILKITATFMNGEYVDVNFDGSNANQTCYHTLFIGPNGVGKSSLLRDIIDIFIEAQSWPKPLKPRKNAVHIKALEYQVGHTRYTLERSASFCHLYKNGMPADIEEMRFPMIIASSMGLFDKFPVYRQRISSSSSRYNNGNYCYVGPKASSNMFMSKMNIFLRSLSRINSSITKKKAKDIENAFKHIGYLPELSFEYVLSEKRFGVLEYINSSYYNKETNDYVNKIKGHSKYIDFNLSANMLDKFESYHLDSLFTYRQEGVFSKLKCKIKTRVGTFVDFDDISSGEFNLLVLMLDIILYGNNKNLLVLLDEPEISQHPNWQIDIVSMLDDALKGYSSHLLIATHSHFLVSNLPLGRSNVINFDKDEQNNIVVSYIQSETYGWSAEEVLLKVFKMSTDRSRYLAEMISRLLENIDNRSISDTKLRKDLTFLQEVSKHLSDVDPMKRVIRTIVSELSM